MERDEANDPRLVTLTAVSGVALSTLNTIDEPPGAIFGYFLEAAGDVNGDGYSDALVGASRGVDEALYLYLGSSPGLGATPGSSVAIPDPSGEWTLAVAGATDFNGDGYADVAVGYGVRLSGQPLVRTDAIYFGGPHGLSMLQSISVPLPATGHRESVVPVAFHRRPVPRHRILA